jgi:DCN1-like protein 1/2
MTEALIFLNIKGDGIIALCSDIGIDPMDVIVLMLMYKLDCKQQYKITRKEWMTGFQNNQIQNLADMKTKIPQVKNSLNDNAKSFKSFYSWCFNYVKETDQKGMAVEVACQTWPVVLSGKYKHLEDWCNFMQVEVAKTIQKDTWDLFYDFIVQVGNDFNNYNEDGAWPVAVDEFVAWMKEGKYVAVRERLAKEREERAAAEE